MFLTHAHRFAAYIEYELLFARGSLSAVCLFNLPTEAVGENYLFEELYHWYLFVVRLPNENGNASFRVRC